MSDYLTQYYRCPDQHLKLAFNGAPAGGAGYFRFGDDVVCYGTCHGAKVSSSPTGPLHDAYTDTVVKNGEVGLPFYLRQIVDNVRLELYVNPGSQGDPLESTANRLYYFARPLLPVAIRRHLQKIRLNGWDKIAFP